MSGSSLLAVFLLVFLSSSGFPVIARAVGYESNVVREITRFHTNGEPDWNSVPWVALGCNEPAEKAIVAILRRGWCQKGYWISVERVGAQYDSHRESSTNGIEKDVIEMFFDVRATTARMDQYEEGVSHFRLVVGRDEKITSLNARLVPIANAALYGARTFYHRLDTGWRTDIFLPWEAIKLDADPRIGLRLSTALRLDHAEPFVGQISIGDQSVDNRNLLEDTPVAFYPVILEGADSADFDDHRVSLIANEVLVAGQPMIELTLTKRADPVTESQRAILTAESGMKITELFSLSYTGRFLQAKMRVKIDPKTGANGAREVLNVAIPDEKWSRTLTVRTPLAQAFAQIDQEIPDAAIEGLTGQPRDLAYLFKACAKETATLISPMPDGRRSPQRRLRGTIFPGYYEAKIQLFIDAALELIASGKVRPGNPYIAWQSQIDKSWQPIKVVHPWNYDPKLVYPARIVVYGLNRNRTRAQFLENDLIALREGSYYPHLGDYFTIVLYGRGNSHEDCGQEELDYVRNTLLKTLPIDPENVALYGGSAGALTAIELGVRYPDWFSWIMLRGGYYKPLLEAREARSTSLLPNLRTSKMYLLAGEMDKPVVESSVAFNRVLLDLGIDSVFREFPTAFHSFSPDDPPEGVLNSRNEQRPRFIDFSTYTPEYGKAYWLQLDVLDRWGVAGRGSGQVDASGLSIELTNVRRFSINRALLPEGKYPEVFMVDGQRLRLADSRNHARLSFAKENGIWKIAETAELAGGSRIKRKGLCGPLKQVEANHVLVVYGTQSAQTLHRLRERAYRISRERSGPDRFQWSGRDIVIKADTEITEEELKSSNLWLIGGPSENALVSKWQESLPLVRERGAIGVAGYPTLQADSLVSFVYPSPADGEHLVLVEWGNSELSYAAPLFGNPNADIVVQSPSKFGSKVSLAENFSTDWTVTSRLQ